MELIRSSDRPGHGAAVDFRRTTLRGIASSPLVRSCGSKGLLLDATAGLGGDSFLLAAAGFTVTSVERSPLVAAVLRDGLNRAAASKSLAAIVGRIELREGDACALIKATPNEWSVIYLDPMYPAKRGSALAAKPIRLVRGAVGPDSDSDSLFRAAAAAACARIVVKRPHHAPTLYPNPDLVFESKLARYDTYFREGKSLSEYARARHTHP